MRKVSIAVPRNCKKYKNYLFQRYMYCFLIEINFKINSILNIGWISSSYFNKKYVTSSSSKPYGMFAYRLTTSKVAVIVFLPHLFRKSTLSLLNLFLRVLRKLLIKCQNINSFLVGRLGPLGPPSMGPSFKPCGSLMFTTSGFCSLIVLVIS